MLVAFLFGDFEDLEVFILEKMSKTKIHGLSIAIVEGEEELVKPCVLRTKCVQKVTFVRLRCLS